MIFAMVRFYNTLFNRFAFKLCISSIFCLAFFTGPSQAESQKIVSEKDIGRLFTTSKQRNYLNKNRKNIVLNNNKNIQESNDRSSIASSTKKVPTGNKTKQVRLSGVVVREDGKEFFWVNGKQLSRTGAEDVFGYSVSSQKSSRASSGRTGNGQNSIVPGQVWLPEKKLIKEGYELMKHELSPAIKNIPPKKSTLKNTQSGDLDVGSLLQEVKTLKE